MNLNQFFQSKGIKITTWAVVAVLVFLLIFCFGMLAGFKRASFSCHWRNNYGRNFGGPFSPEPGFPKQPLGQDFLDAHGVLGQIIKIDGSTLVVRDQYNTEKIIVVKSDTTIRNFRDSIKIMDLKVDQKIIIIGQPNDQGQIEAKLIRVLPDQGFGGFRERPMSQR